MPDVIVIGGGLAGLSAAAALGGAGYAVRLFESRPFLGGRATSYEAGNETIDNCQHILLRCCVNLMDFYRRLGVADRIKFYKQFYFIEPGGRTSTLAAGRLPAPLHFTGSFWKLTFLSLSDKIGIARALLAIRGEHGRRQDLDRISMLDWLREKRQTEPAIRRFWNQVLVSAVNEDLDRMAAVHGFQVFRLGFLARSNSYEMGVPSVPLGELYSSGAWKRIGNVRLHLREPVEAAAGANGSIQAVTVQGQPRTADYFVSALPFERVSTILPQAEIAPDRFAHSPITGIHLWFDRSVTQLPHATLLDRTVQWMFNKSGGRYLELVVSASRGLVDMSRNDVIELAVRELGEFFPRVREAKLEKAHVVKEVRATFSPQPGVESLRPQNATKLSNLFLAGDWTRSGWPATMEGAVRSGYLAAEAVTRASGHPRQFVLPDIA
jgi:squalene-associated FAD-dependent desaturase